MSGAPPALTEEESAAMRKAIAAPSLMAIIDSMRLSMLMEQANVAPTAAAAAAFAMVTGFATIAGMTRAQFVEAAGVWFDMNPDTAGKVDA